MYIYSISAIYDGFYHTSLSLSLFHFPLLKSQCIHFYESSWFVDQFSIKWTFNILEWRCVIRSNYLLLLIKPINLAGNQDTFIRTFQWWCRWFKLNVLKTADTKLKTSLFYYYYRFLFSFCLSPNAILLLLMWRKTTHYHLSYLSCSWRIPVQYSNTDWNYTRNSCSIIFTGDRYIFKIYAFSFLFKRF